jgi:glucosamine-6-phosphate deaminase
MTAPSSGFRIETLPTRAACGAAAGRAAAEALRAVIAANGAARVVFAAAPSQSEMLAALMAAPAIDWSKVTAFHMDEYIGLAAGAPQRFAAWLDRHLFEEVRFGRVERIRPEPDAAAECGRYAALLAEAPIDLVCLGIGVNGHVAFNDPPVADFDDPLDVKIVELDAVCRQQQVDDGAFATFADVPREAITLTVPRLMRADRLICTVPGPAKRAAVAATSRGPLSTECPASILRTHPACTLYLDRESHPDG